MFLLLEEERIRFIIKFLDIVLILDKGVYHSVNQNCFRNACEETLLA